MAHAIDLLRKQERGAVAEQQREWLPCRARRTRKRPRLDQLERHFVVVEHGRERVVHMAGEVFQRQQFHASPPSGASPAWYRSEEHTSELQSLMRISYAVFCLKKKKIREQIK